MGRAAAIAALIWLLATPPAVAADDGAAAGAPPADLQSLIDRIQARLARMNQAAGANGAALDYLQKQVDQAIDRLDTRQDENEALRDHAEDLRGTVDIMATTETTLNQQIGGLRESLADSGRQLADLQAEVGRLTALLEQEKQAATAKLATAQDERDRAVAELEAQVARLSDMLLAEREETAVLNDDLVALREENAQAGRELRATLGEMREQRAAYDAELARANHLLAELRQQLATLNQALEASEAKNTDQQTVIFELEKRLNQALASKTLELARYRSEFFGRLREALGTRDDIGIVGDRFVFQSEVLFGSGEATLGPAGRLQLVQFADTLQQVAANIPPDIKWILRVDGHTDRRPISNDRFPTNWELSTARATEVVRFLIRQGIPPERLMAAGFGEFYPITEGTTLSELRRNRRIEFRLTQP
jgi:chemotaxis protein MotB